MDTLYNCGFDFFRAIDDETVILENRYSGLGARFNTKTGNYVILDEPIPVQPLLWE